jgi:hypothetical protein
LTLEAALVGAICFACLLPLALAIPSHSSSRFLLASGFLCASVAVAWAAHRQVPVSPKPPTKRPIEVLEGGYASSAACAACHPSQFESWHSSYHRTMTQVASAASVLGDFDDVELRTRGERVRLSRRGDEHWAELRIPDPQSGEPGKRHVERRIELVTGSHHMQVYWYATGAKRALAQLPFAYLIFERRWVPVDATFLAPPGGRALHIAEGSWNTTCQKCHATRGQARMDAQMRFDTHVAEFGIACEACHGPAAEHVRRNESPLRRYGYHWSDTEDPTSLVPTRLDAVRSSQVCGQCHSVYRVPDAELSRWNALGFRYRPGDDLGAARRVVRLADHQLVRVLRRDDPEYIEQHFWTDGMVRVSGREYNGLIESPCYTHGDAARGVLACTSCHRMHREPDDPRTVETWANDQLGAGMEGNAACVGCHASYEGRGLEAHTHHAAESAGSGCYNCHMPYTSYGLLKAIRSHQISSPSVASTLETGRPNACNQCHLDETLKWSSEWLKTWYGSTTPRLSELDERVSMSIRMTLSGDAGQRALMAWSMGWPDARRASGSDWMAPYLGELLTDDYDAVRFIAQRSLRTLPGFEELPYDFLLPPEVRRQSLREIRRIWSRDAATREPRPELLISDSGLLRAGPYRDLRRRRDLRPVDLAE